MKKFKLYWSNYFNGKKLNENAAVSLKTKDGEIIQIDTGCPFTFINYDYALVNNMIDASYIKNSKDFSINELGHKFFYLKNHNINIENYSFTIEKCYLELDKTKDIKKKKNTYWINELNKQNIGYLGLDFFYNSIVEFDFHKSTLKFIDEKFTNLMPIKITSNSSYCIFNLELDNKSYKVMFDTGSSSSGFIINNKFKKYFDKLILHKEEIIRNDFVSNIEYGFLNSKIIFDNGYKINDNIKIEFPDNKFNSYLFNNDKFDAILGLQFLRNYKCTFDFKNNNLYIE